METPKPRQQQEKKKKKLPTAQELISHYESRGMEPQAAAVKVIEDLQSAVIRLAAVAKKNRLPAGAGGRLDADAASLLAVVDAKLDSKPGYADALAIGVASGTAVNGVAFLLPHLAAAASDAWNSARSVFKQ